MWIDFSLMQTNSVINYNCESSVTVVTCGCWHADDLDEELGAVMLLGDDLRGRLDDLRAVNLLLVCTAETIQVIFFRQISPLTFETT